MASNPEPRSPISGSPAPTVDFFGLKGRIGRIRMIAYPIALGIIIALPLVLVVSVTGPESNVALLVLFALGVVYLVMTAIWTIRRVQDFEGPIWLAAIFIITMIFLPIVNVVLWFIPGTKGDNRYGPAPPPNGAGVYILATLVLTIPIIGIVAAIAIPAYHDYTVRAKIQEGVNMANAHRTAVGIACTEGRLKAGITSAELGLSGLGDFSGKYTKGIAVVGVSPEVAEVIITYRGIGNAVEEGGTVVYSAACGLSGVTWSVSGTVAEKLLPTV